MSNVPEAKPSKSHDGIVSIADEPASIRPATIHSGAVQAFRFRRYKTANSTSTCVKKPLTGLRAALMNGINVEGGPRFPQEGLVDGKKCLASAPAPDMTRPMDTASTIRTPSVEPVDSCRFVVRPATSASATA